MRRERDNTQFGRGLLYALRDVLLADRMKAKTHREDLRFRRMGDDIDDVIQCVRHCWYVDRGDFDAGACLSVCS